jgi:hypothetical protein
MGERLLTNVARVALSCTCLARIIREGLYYNRRYAAATSLTSGSMPFEAVYTFLSMGAGWSDANFAVSGGVPARRPEKEGRD